MRASLSQAKLLGKFALRKDLLKPSTAHQGARACLPSASAVPGGEEGICPGPLGVFKRP
jgi:hypothetical protein